MSDDGFQVRPGRVRDRGGQAGGPKSLVAQVRALSNKAGGIGKPARASRGTGRRARGRAAALGIRSRQGQRRVLVKARIVRHHGVRFSAAPLARHVAYLKREGVTRDGRDADLFDAGESAADGGAFAARCAGDRHHFRFIVSPEDAPDMCDIRAFTRELMGDMAVDLGTSLDWVAVDHWNTGNPHVHILLRGKGDDGRDLVIDRDYIREGIRNRAEQRVTIELGLRTEREIDRALAREVGADRWTGLDRRLVRLADRSGGVIDLRLDPGANQFPGTRHLIGRATRLERLGLATRIAAGCWTLNPGLEPALRQLGARGDIIKTMHRAMGGDSPSTDPGRFALHSEPSEPIVGRLIERGLHDELSGEAYAIVDGADGRVHHIRFPNLEATGDALPGAIVELKTWADKRGRPGQALNVQSDLGLAEQITANGATWLDRQLVRSAPLSSAGGFGGAIEQALHARAEHLANEGLATRRGSSIFFARNLLEKLRSRELADAVENISSRTGLANRSAGEGDHISGTYRERVDLASGRFAMIDDGMGFELVPWRPNLDRYLGEQVRGTVKANGGIDWAMGRSRGLAV